MKNAVCFARTVLLAAMIVPAGACHLMAQETWVYASVISSGKFIVGAANAGTGLFLKSETNDTAWTHMGPQRIRANGFTIDPGSGRRTIYIASGNGVIRSTDEGATWRLLTGWRITEVLGIALDPHHPGRIAIATAYGVFRSIDDGESWTECNTGRSFPQFTSTVIFDPSVPDRLLCSAEDGIYASSDGGLSWGITSCTAQGVRTIVRHPRLSNILAAGTEDDGVFISADGGLNWEHRPAPEGANTVYAIAFAPDADSSIFIGGYDSGVHASADLGSSWASRSIGLTVRTVHALAVDPADSRRMYAGTIWGGIYRSKDAGLTWSYAGLIDSQVVSLAFVVF